MEFGNLQNIEDERLPGVEEGTARLMADIGACLLVNYLKIICTPCKIKFSTSDCFEVPVRMSICDMQQANKQAGLPETR